MSRSTVTQIDAPERPQVPTPADGDIVVVMRQLNPRNPAVNAFGVRQSPGAVQFTDTRDRALQLARSFAKTHAVDLWYEDETAFRLLERHRPALVPVVAAGSGLPQAVRLQQPVRAVVSIPEVDGGPDGQPPRTANGVVSGGRMTLNDTGLADGVRDR